MRIQATAIVSQALCCIIVVKVACSASCCVEKKCDDFESNLKTSLKIFRIFMSNRHISEMAGSVYIYAHSPMLVTNGIFNDLG